ncbi:hypothetical protein BKA93DRAFT_758009 [Sparassis latifolia]
MRRQRHARESYPRNLDASSRAVCRILAEFALWFLCESWGVCAAIAGISLEFALLAEVVADAWVWVEAANELEVEVELSGQDIEAEYI